MPTKRQKPGKTDICTVPECGRPAYAKSLCQTHHRQMLASGSVTPIRPYRKRSLGTVKFAGLRLSSHCAEKIEQKAEVEGISKGAAIAEILEDWKERLRSRRATLPPPAKPKR